MLSMCLVAISLVLPVDGDTSRSYARKFNKGIDHRVQNCMTLVHLSKQMKAPTLLILAIASVESGFKSRQVSSAGARGLLGVMPSNMKGRDKGSRHAWEKRGIEILMYLMERKDLCNSLAYYNAGSKGTCTGLGGGYAALVTARYYRLCMMYDSKECYTC